MRPIRCLLTEQVWCLTQNRAEAFYQSERSQVLSWESCWFWFTSLCRVKPRRKIPIQASSSAQQQEIPQPLQPARPATASPSVEPSVEPSASPSIETPSPQNSYAPVELSNSPISTAAGEKGVPVVIRLHSGLTIEADEAWQTGEGIWYRKHGVVSLLDPKNVKAIERVSPAAPQPSASSSPSP